MCPATLPNQPFHPTFAYLNRPILSRAISITLPFPLYIRHIHADIDALFADIVAVQTDRALIILKSTRWNSGLFTCNINVKLIGPYSRMWTNFSPGLVQD